MSDTLTLLKRLLFVVAALAILGTCASPAPAMSGWSAPALIDPAFHATAVSCPSSTFCAAVDNAGDAVTFDGLAWGSQARIDGSPGPNGLVSVSCPTASFCVAVDSNGNALTYNGASWSTPVRAGGGTLSSVSCTSSTFCAAVGATS